MKNPSDHLNHFKKLSQEILAERKRLQDKLEKLDEKLAAMGCTNDRFYGPRTPTGRYRNFKSLRETVIDLLRAHPEGLTKEEILHRVLQGGYVFASDDPMNSLGVVLYGHDPKFARIGRRFALERSSPAPPPPQFEI